MTGELSRLGAWGITEGGGENGDVWNRQPVPAISGTLL